ncbi:hypothetical protein GCM10009596_26310 [Arthrobacter rhombi]|uniref:GH25 family lysozyme n=1 Tax=Arthrobacter rhombi TaxID=71253 RepID=UPI0031D14364
MKPTSARRRMAAIPLTLAFALASMQVPASASPADPGAASPDQSAQVAQKIADALAQDELPAAERRKLATEAVEALKMPELPAQMGQGARRIAETGSAQVPTRAELAQLAQEAGGTDVSIPARDRGQVSALAAAVAPAYTSGNGWWRPPGVPGVDVSSHQGNVDWAYAYGKGARFAYVKATQSWPSTLYKNPYFNQQYNGSYKAGLIRGAYHFAMPATSSGTTQARQFVANGGGWSADGKTMPPLLDIEWNPYSAADYPQGKGSSCFGMTPTQLTTWIAAFGNEVKRLTGRVPMIYTASSWWNECTNKSTKFKGWPLHIARYPSAAQDTPGALPGGWPIYSVWQYSTTTGFISPTKGVDGNVFNGSLAGLKKFAGVAG